MIRPIFVPALLVLAITRVTLAAAAYVHYHFPNPNIYHFGHLLPRQDSSFVGSDIPTPAAPSSLPTTIDTAGAAVNSPADTTNFSSAQPSASIASDSGGTPTAANGLIFPLDPTTSSSSSQSSTQQGTSPQSSTSSSSSSSSSTPPPGPNTAAATMSQLGQSSTTTVAMGGSTAVSAVQGASFQLGSGSSMVTAAGAGATGLHVEPGSDVMTSGVASGIVRDGRYWGLLAGMLGVVWIR